jgi:para-nitrobenzyl esterase
MTICKRLHGARFAGLIGVASALTLIGAQAVAATPTQVRIDSGSIEGAVNDGVLSFKGIPFAAPPLGNLRWRPPQPVQTWEGVREAKEYGHDCMQKPFPGDAAPLGNEPGEDCLTLNVWRPAGKVKKLPVMVWIYGGGFVNGGSSPAVYSGAQFAKQNVAFVSFNYRLGRFGFFGFPALTQEFPDELKGNYGYMDQLAALQWVQRNIAAFGGDPNNVTVFGESAGGGSVHMLLTSPLAQGLFHKAIVQSGGGRGSLMGERRLAESKPGLPSAEEIGVNFARKHGIEGTSAEALAQLRALPAEQIVDGMNMAALFAPAKVPLYGGPIIDDRIVVAAPETIYRNGGQAKVPIITGANSADIGLGFFPTKDALFAAFGPLKDQAMPAYPRWVLPSQWINR